jgi:hypothetical protein
MHNAFIKSCFLLLIAFLLAGCSGKPKTAKPASPAAQTPPAKAAQPDSPEATAPTQVAVTPAPEAKPPRQAAATPPAPAPKLALPSPAEKSLGLPIYPGAKPETATPLTNVGDFAQKLVVTTADSMEQVETYYTKQFPGATIVGRGKVGDQPFENIVLVSGKGEKRVFFFQPSAKKEVRIELTVGK